MNRLSEWFLNQKALNIFLLSFLGIPLYLWLFSITYQLDKRRGKSGNYLKTVFIALITVYPLIYFFFFIGSFFNLFGGNIFDLFDYILPYHFAGMLCGFLLMIIGANSYGK